MEEGKRQGMIAPPRVGRSSSSSNSQQQGYSRDCSSNPELCNNLLNALLGSEAWSSHNMHHKSNMHEHDLHEGMPGPTPRIHKRSASADEEMMEAVASMDDIELTKTLRSNWDWGKIVPLEDRARELFRRHARQLIPAPRVGKRFGASDSRTHLNNALLSGLSASASTDEDSFDPIDLQVRAAFVPRIGKRFEETFGYSDGNINEFLKRAAAFTPRIGRAAFTPRIGKKAAFTPRIG